MERGLIRGKGKIYGVLRFKMGFQSMGVSEKGEMRGNGEGKRKKMKAVRFGFPSHLIRKIFLF